MLRKRLIQFLSKEKLYLIDENSYTKDLEEKLSKQGIVIDEKNGIWFVNIPENYQESKIRDLINNFNTLYDEGVEDMKLNTIAGVEIAKRYLIVNKQPKLRWELNNDTFTFKGPLAFILNTKIKICELVFYSLKSPIILDKSNFEKKIILKLFHRQSFIDFLYKTAFPDKCFYIDTKWTIPVIYNSKAEDTNLMINWFNRNLTVHIEDQTENIHEFLSFKSNYRIFDKLLNSYPIIIQIWNIENPKIIIGGYNEHTNLVKNELLIFLKDNIYVQESVQYPVEKLLLIENAFETIIPSAISIDHSNNFIEFNGKGRLIERLKCDIREFCKGIHSRQKRIDNIKFANFILKKDLNCLNTLKNGDIVSLKLIDEDRQRILNGVTIDQGLERGMKIVKGSIKDQQVDVIVNQIFHDGSKSIDPTVDELIGKDQLLKLKTQKADAQKYNIVETESGNLKNTKKIYHVSVPPEDDNHRAFTNIVKSIFDKAEYEKMESIAIPCLGVVKTNYPKDIVAFVLISETIKFLESSKVKYLGTIVFPISDNEMFKIFINEYLKIKLNNAKSRIVDASTPIQENYKWDFGDLQYTVSRGNILEYYADGIINTIGNSNILNSNGKLSNELEIQGGEEYKKICRKIAPVENVQIMPSTGNIKPKYVIHIMAPRIPTKEAWIDRIASAFLLADNMKLVSIVIPAFGTGHCGNQGDDMAIITMEAIELFCKHNPKSVKQINVVIFQESLFPIYKKWSRQIKQGQKLQPITTFTPITLQVNSTNEIAINKFWKETFNDYELSMSSKIFDVPQHLNKKVIKDLIGNHKTIEYRETGGEVELFGDEEEIKYFEEYLNHLSEKIADDFNEKFIERRIKWYVWYENRRNEYSSRLNCLIEQAYKRYLDNGIVKNETRFFRFIQEGKVFYIDFEYLIEIDENNEVFTVKRGQINDIPEEWVEPFESNREISLDFSEKEYKNVQSRIGKNLRFSFRKKINDLKINRYQNLEMWKIYSQHRNFIKKKLGQDKIEQELFYIANKTDIHEILKYGFNRNRINRDSRINNGITFHLNLQLLDNNDIKDEIYVILSKVIVGRMIIRTDRNQIPLPEETFVDRRHEPREFTIVHDDAAYPYFVIKFKIV
ncbi:DgyrCDS10816 [Dimorphilus gyrociliatus]|uniref:DgyrCDS10816 n=1 Tax=Dimorphilus gyrociliatus TaxID=2664684 RepID=A0A7I8W1H6_9ANNE|nr:DgyrCDS10816 [Dimorphilus gyrociliatus]